MAYTVLDVSKYNTVSNYASAAAAINGVIIRVGYRGYGSSGTLVKDNLFDTHYSGFAGKTKVGMYWFSQAISEAEAIAEANYVYNIIKGKQVDFPVYIDSEYSNTSHNGRADGLSKADRTKITIAFCERIKALGYRAGVYASDSWFGSNLNLAQLQANKYSIWVARYSSTPPSVVKNYDGWQYTSSGSIPGVNSSCDLTRFYNDIAGWVAIKPNINSYTLYVPQNSFDYTGSVINPPFSINGLTAGVDFTYSYNNNINVGTGTCIITGIGNYQGTRSFNFTINPLSISRRKITLSGYGFIYNGSAITPNIEVEGLNATNFNISYSNNINAGSATAKATGKGNYKDSVSAVFTISPKSIDGLDISIPVESYEYTGNPITPVVTISGLRQNTDFTVAYKNNINIGTASITVVGINNYTGAKTINFRIAEVAIIISTYTVALSYTTTEYNKNPQCPEVTIPGLVKDRDYTFEVSDNINVGIATIKIIGINDYTGTIVQQFTITKKDIKDLSISLPKQSYEYTGEEIKPEPLAGDLILDTDYTITYSNNIDVGNGFVTCTGKGNYQGTISLPFEITKCNIKEEMVTLNNYTYIYDGTEKIPNVTLSDHMVENRDYTIKYKDNVNAGTAYVIITGIGNYVGDLEVQYTINRQSIVGRLVEFEGGEYLYNITPIEPETIIPDLRKNIDYEVKYYDNIVPGTAKVVISGINNYQGDITKEFNIIVRDIEQCVAKYGRPSIKTIYRVEDGRGLRIYIDKSETNELKLDFDYQINGSSIKETSNFKLYSYTIKGFGGFSGEAVYNFRVVDVEPDTPIDYEDDGVYNFGDEDLGDESAYGNYDFKNLDSEEDEYYPEPIIPDNESESIPELAEEVPDIVKDGEDYDFDSMSGMYLDHYDEDTGTNIDDDGNDKKDPDIEPIEDDDGVYNFGDIDLNDESAKGVYDFGSLDEGVDKESVAKGDYDFNKFAGDVEEWLAAGTEFELRNTPMYSTYSSPIPFDKKSGVYFIYNSSTVNGRVRMSRTDGAVEMPGRSAGWCKTIDLLNLDSLKVGDRVLVSGKIHEFANGGGGYMDQYEGTVMYICEIFDNTQYRYPYALASGPKSSRIGFASESILSKPENL